MSWLRRKAVQSNFSYPKEYECEIHGKCYPLKLMVPYNHLDTKYGKEICFECFIVLIEKTCCEAKLKKEKK